MCRHGPDTATLQPRAEQQGLVPAPSGDAPGSKAAPAPCQLHSAEPVQPEDSRLKDSADSGAQSSLGRVQAIAAREDHDSLTQHCAARGREQQPGRAVRSQQGCQEPAGLSEPHPCSSLSAQTGTWGLQPRWAWKNKFIQLPKFPTWPPRSVCWDRGCCHADP